MKKQTGSKAAIYVVNTWDVVLEILFSSSSFIFIRSLEKVGFSNGNGLYPGLLLRFSIKASCISNKNTAPRNVIKNSQQQILSALTSDSTCACRYLCGLKRKNKR
ncbi:hypothetical protein OUZ56_014567 [Daphnia magna]|uniref:Uncharacterized protein n=1 Tax=Daphnia magna TaxID=35525 RepID=A0ABR0AK63_9CRUS|nr:hypothetical protein OUZ56_014567 [Daphnia magna]